MAIAFQIVYTYADDSGDTASHAIDVPTTFNLGQYVEFGQGMAAFLDAIVHGVIRSAELTVNVDIAGLTNNTIVADCDVEEVGGFQFNTAEKRPVNVNIPALDETKVLAGSDNLDLSDPDVAAFIAAMQNGIVVTGGTIAPSDVDEDDIEDLVYAREQFRASGKRR